MSKLHFKIIVPFHNVEKWIKFCIKSVKIQTYNNFECILVDDCSTDNTRDIILNEIKLDKRFKLILKERKGGALSSICRGIKESNASDEDVIITLDGDDWFYNENVLNLLKKVYEEKQCWMTYGNYIEYPSGEVGRFSKQIPEDIINENKFRESNWMSSHLRTCKYKLWKRIKEEDLKNLDGNYYEMTADLATVFPMLEMSGKKSHFINDILLVYNRLNSNSEDKVNHFLQLSIEKEIRNKHKYQLINYEI